MVFALQNPKLYIYLLPRLIKRGEWKITIRKHISRNKDSKLFSREFLLSLDDLPPPPPPSLIDKLDREREKREITKQSRFKEKTDKKMELQILEKLTKLNQRALRKAQEKKIKLEEDKRKKEEKLKLELLEKQLKDSQLKEGTKVIQREKQEEEKRTKEKLEFKLQAKRLREEERERRIRRIKKDKQRKDFRRKVLLVRERKRELELLERIKNEEDKYQKLFDEGDKKGGATKKKELLILKKISALNKKVIGLARDKRKELMEKKRRRELERKRIEKLGEVKRKLEEEKRQKGERKREGEARKLEEEKKRVKEELRKKREFERKLGAERRENFLIREREAELEMLKAKKQKEDKNRVERREKIKRIKEQRRQELAENEIAKAIQKAKKPKLSIIKTLKDMVIDINLKKSFKKKSEEKLPIKKIPDMEIDIPLKKQVIAHKTDIPEETKLNELDFIKQKIYDARDALMKLDLERAKNIYIGIMVLYNKLKDKNKAKVYEDIKELYEDRKHAESMFRKR